MTMETAKDICKGFDNTFLFTDEGELLNTFIDLIDDADIPAVGTVKDMIFPHISNRITRVLSKEDLRRSVCLDNIRKRTFDRSRKEELKHLTSRACTFGLHAIVPQVYI